MPKKDSAKKAKAVDFHLGNDLKGVLKNIPTSNENSYCQEAIRALNILKTDENPVSQLNALKRLGSSITSAKRDATDAEVDFYIDSALPVAEYVLFNGKGVQPTSAAIFVIDQLNALESIKGSRKVLSVFEEHASKYLSDLTVFSAAETLERDDFPQICIMLYTLADSTHGVSVLSNHHQVMYSYLVNILDEVTGSLCQDTSTLTEESQDATTSVTDDTSFSSKKVACCHDVLRLLTNFTMKFDAWIMTSLAIEETDYHGILKIMTHALVRLLFTTNAASKECLVLAGIALGSVMKVQPDLRSLVDLLLLPAASLKNAYDSGSNEALVLGAQSNPIFDFSVVSLSNGILSALPEEWFAQKSLNQTSTPLETLFEVSCSVLDATIKSAVRVMAVHAISSWFSVYSKLVKTHDPHTLVSRPQEIFSRTFLYVCTFWDDPIDTMHFKLRNIFSVLVETLAPEDTNGESFSVHVVIKNLVNAEGFRKFKYDLLSYLLEKYPPSVILQYTNTAEFFASCFSYLSTTGIQSRVCLFIGKLYTSILSEGIVKKDLWIHPLLESLCSESHVVRKAVSDNILVQILKNHPSVYAIIIEDLSSRRSTEYRYHGIFAVMKAGRTLDLVPESLGSGSIPTLDALMHTDETLRSDALGFLCESRRTLAEPTGAELGAMKVFLIANATENTAEFRQRIRGFVQKLVARIRRCLYANTRKLAIDTARVPDSPTILETKNLIALKTSFLEWLLSFVVSCLYPGNPHARCGLALEIILAVIEAERYVIDTTFHSDKSTGLEVFLNEKCARALVTVLATTNFDGNRDFAFSLLMGIGAGVIEGLEDDYLKGLIEKGTEMAIQPRIKDSENGACLLRFVFATLEYRKVQLWKNVTEEPNLRVAFVQHILSILEARMNETAQKTSSETHLSIHGLLLAQRFMFTDLTLSKSTSQEEFAKWRLCVNKLVKLCFNACESVLTILTKASPEGSRANEDDAAEEDGFTVGGHPGQAPLFYSFRTLKEATAALAAISTSAGCFNADESKSLISHAIIKEIGESLLEYLMSIRHRGAFSAVYTTFVDICAFVSVQKVDALNSLPRLWLNKLLKMMSAFSVSTTRRSAGLPLAISAILINPSPFQTQLLASTMKTLFAEAKVPVNVPEGKVLLDVPQIHAFNIMRELLLHAELSNHMRDYIGQAFILSIESFSSPYFPLRNCATMLFSTLVSKSLGTKRDKNEDDDTNTVTTRAFFSKFPELYSFLLKVLEKDGLVDVNEKDISKSLVYPVLTILVRLKPLKTSSHHDGFDMKRFEAAIEKCLSLPFWQLRDIAARSFAALISADGVVAKVRDIIDKVTEMCTEDETHGLLLQATYLILNGKREGAIGVEAVSLLTAWAEKSWLFSRLTLVNKAAALRILNILLDDAIKLPESLAAKLWSVPVKEVWQICCKTIDLPSTRHPGEVRFQKEATRFILEVCSVIEGDYSKTTSSKIFGVVSKNIIKHDTPMQVEALSFLKRFYFRRALNSMERKDVLDMLSALLAEESTPDIIKSDAGRFLVVLGKETTIPVNSILYKLGQMLEESKGSKMALLLALYCSQFHYLELSSTIASLARTLQASLDFDEQFASGETIVGCLDLLPSILLKVSKESTFTFYRLLYICLSDARADVREQASRIASRWVEAGINYGSFSVRTRLLKHMCDAFVETVNEEPLMDFVLGELVGKDTYETIKEAEETRKKILFPHEDPNLYRDHNLEGIFAYRAIEYLTQKGHASSVAKRSESIKKWAGDFLDGLKNNSRLDDIDGSSKIHTASLRLVTVVKALERFIPGQQNILEKKLRETDAGDIINDLKANEYARWEEVLSLCPKFYQ